MAHHGSSEGEAHPADQPTQAQPVQPGAAGFNPAYPQQAAYSPAPSPTSAYPQQAGPAFTQAPGYGIPAQPTGYAPPTPGYGDTPMSAPPMSAPPMSAPPISPLVGAPMSAPPGAVGPGYQATGAFAAQPVTGFPVTGQPAYGQPGYQGPTGYQPAIDPATGMPVSAMPVAGMPVTGKRRGAAVPLLAGFLALAVIAAGVFVGLYLDKSSKLNKSDKLVAQQRQTIADRDQDLTKTKADLKDKSDQLAAAQQNLRGSQADNTETKREKEIISKCLIMLTDALTSKTQAEITAKLKALQDPCAQANAVLGP